MKQPTPASKYYTNCIALSSQNQNLTQPLKMTTLIQNPKPPSPFSDQLKGEGKSTPN